MGSLILGLFLLLLGLPLVFGGAKLIAAGGSWYYLPAGLAFVASGALLMMRRPLSISSSWRAGTISWKR